MYRSPLAEFVVPASPSPDKRILSPVLIPGGILIFTDFVDFMRPEDLQFEHGSFIIVPWP